MAPPLTSRVAGVLSLTSTLTVAISLLNSRSLQRLLIHHFHPTTHPVRFVSLVLTLLLNIKALPFVWHLRLFRGMLRLARKPPAPLPHDALFRPIVVKGNYTSLPECDYNAHKSNSTYFADLDVGRTMLVSTLLNQGYRSRKKDDFADARAAEEMQKLSGDSAAAPPGDKSSSRNILVALGGVTCHFKRELKPYEPFEVWTRVLSWDRKWVYLVSHMVRAGAVQVDSWALQPWKKKDKKLRKGAKHGTSLDKPANGHAVGPAPDASPAGAYAYEQTQAWKDAVFASSISKYVVKRGRKTIPPELVLRRSKLLPERPASSTTGDEHGDAKTEQVSSSAKETDNGPTAWTWTNIERERLRGLRLSEAFGLLDELHAEFPISQFGFGSSADKGKGEAEDGAVHENELDSTDTVLVQDSSGAWRPAIDTLGVFRDVLSW